MRQSLLLYRDCRIMYVRLGGVKISNIGIKMTEMYMLEQLADGKTAIHRLHPMVKLVSTLFYIVVVISVGRYDFFTLIPFLFYPSILMPISETPYKPLFKRLLIALPFSLFAGISNIIFDTQISSYIYGVGISYGVISFFTILLKTYLTVMAVLLLVSTTTLKDLSHQLTRLKVPPVIVMLFTMIYRYISILLNEASTMFTSYILRCPKGKGINIRHMGSFVGQLLLRSIDRAERVYYAMKCRGYHGAVSYAQKRKMSFNDCAYLILICAIASSFRFIDFTYIMGKLFI